MSVTTIYDYSMQKRKMWNMKIRHYYGDIVRKLFLASSFLMLFFLPFMLHYIPLPYYLAFFGLLLLNVFSGITNPRLLWVSIVDIGIAFVGVLIFGYHAIDAYVAYTAWHMYFWVNQVQALIFLASLYYSVKTVRGYLIAQFEE